ncbi:MAG: RNA polymerase sigma factor [candidate division Zixibacteria bacterium]|nr:RNA polymerase sigma factor [candidate division Zixibacteria bacterium]
MVIVYQLADLVGTGVKSIARNFQAKIAISDSQLLNRAKDGDDTAFNELVCRHQNFIYKLAWGYLNEKEAAKDATQDVFIKAYQGLPYFQSDSQFTTWLYRICKNHCLNLLRRQKRESELELDRPNNTESDLPMKLGLKKMIANLSEEYREIIILRYYQDLKYDQIARLLDIPLSTVKIRLHRAKAELKNLAGVGSK